jgi:hypothetical protein
LWGWWCSVCFVFGFIFASTLCGDATTEQPKDILGRQGAQIHYFFYLAVPKLGESTANDVSTYI